MRLSPIPAARVGAVRADCWAERRDEAEGLETIGLRAPEKAKSAGKPDACMLLKP
jgi:hypothetical protein